ncbi:MAG TPA: glycosyltransferase family 1 protein [Planctomycetota bacterium]|nr:glycosyltransferase family 1 protein [Planctomycetota bacterium]
MSGLEIGVDATCWANGRGYGRFTREICTAMVKEGARHRFVFFADERAADCFELRAPNARLITVAQRVSPTQAAAADGNRGVLDMLRLTRAVWREKLDVFFCPSVYTYFPLPPGLRAVVTIHDAIAERYPHLTLPSRKARLFWRAKVKLALAQARLVLTVSEFSARELAEVLGVSPARLRVSLEAPPPLYAPSDSADRTAAAKRAKLPDSARWFCYVGGFNPHKHVDLIVRAHAALAAKLEDPPHLLLVGTVDSDVFHGDQARIRDEIQAHQSENLVHWTGFVADSELRHLHSGALALLLPSECEGFGLPAVEAAACGTPVIATRNSPLPELLEGGGIFVAPGDLAALEAAMTQLASDEPTRKAMGLRALERARALTWPAGARAALAAIEEAAA